MLSSKVKLGFSIEKPADAKKILVEASSLLERHSLSTC